MKNLDHYKLFAELFRYPSEETVKYAAAWTGLVMKYDSRLTEKLDPFIREISGNTLSSMQECYCSTFDVQAVCSMDIGYVLLGDDHKRGIFLSHMKEEQEKAANPCGSDLADHLPNILTLLPRIKDPAFSEELVCSVLKPALRSMISSFGSSGNIYKELFGLLMAIMELDYPENESDRISLSDWRKTGLTGNIRENAVHDMK